MKLLAFCMVVIACIVQPGYCVQTKLLVAAPAATCSHDDLTVAIIMVDKKKNTDVHVLVLNPHTGATLDEKNVKLEWSNNFMALVKLQVKPDDVEKWKEDFVRLMVKWDGDQHLESDIPLTSRRGLVFVQTDRPIYTPNSDVKIRLFPVTRQLNPIAFPLAVDIINPDGVIVDRIEKTAFQVEKVMELGPFHIPAITRLGNWKIVSRLEDKPQFNYTSGFKVEEYVLPTFDVSITSEQPYLHIYDKSFTIHIKAMHLYGKPVVGRAYVRYGVKHQSKKTLLSTSTRLVQFVQGEAMHTLMQEHILKQFPDPKLLLGDSLYVEASVISADAGEIENALLDDIPIVASPYNIESQWTVPFFKPGLPYICKVLVLNPDGFPAAGVPVKVSFMLDSSGGNWISENQITQKDGIAMQVINTNKDSKKLDIKVQTEDVRLDQSQQAETSFTISLYSSPSGSFINLNTRGEVKSPGDRVFFDVFIKSDDIDKIINFNYLVVSNGKIHKCEAEGRKGLTTSVSLLLTHELVPQFRLVAFFILPSGELVSDSIVIDVQDSCHAKLSLEVAGGNRHFTPKDDVDFDLSGEPDSWVAVGAVDKAAYVLDKQNKLTGKKVYKAMEESDLGCSVGSGKTGPLVFRDAGLAIMAKQVIGMDDVKDSRCPNRRTRRKRELVLDIATNKAKTYPAELQICCRDAAIESPLGFTCEERAKHIDSEDERCRNVFLECCKHVAEEILIAEEDEEDFGQSQAEDSMIQESKVVIRSYFPESFMWEVIDLSRKAVKGKTIITKKMPDSITTWDIQAVEVSQSKGLCVGPSLELTVFKQFFLKVHTPYALKQYEQVELRVVIYNYGNRHVKGEIQVKCGDDICTDAEPHEPIKSRFSVEKNSAASFSFMVVPLATGESYVSVLARVFGSDVHDAVEKKLRIMPEGNYEEISLSWPIQPTRHGGKRVIIIKNETPKNVVPGTEMSSFLSAQGNLIAETIQNTVKESKISSLLRLPRGCGEQNMMYTSITVMVARYLNQSDQWSQMGDPLAKDRALNFIRSGYASQLNYRKGDYSYAAWIGRPSSTWLTAFVTKVFSQASRLVYIEVNEICGSVRWLMKKQQPDGSFIESLSIVHENMMGQVSGDVLITSFVFIAMLEARETCINQVEGFTPAVERAHGYLTTQALNGLDSYPLAITAYALSLWKTSDAAAKHTMNKLKTSGQQTDESIHWGSDIGKAAAVESTAYGLLAAIQHEESEVAEKATNWLSQSAGFGGGFQSTQDTVMALQALTQFESRHAGMKNLALTFKIRGEENGVFDKEFQITNDNAFVQKPFKVPVHGKLTVTASGTGQGILTFVQKYREKVAIKKDCNGFSLSITTTRQDNDQDGQRPHQLINPEFNVYRFFSCFRYERKEKPGMVVMDISLPTGFAAKKKDLDDMKNLVDTYIVQYELRPGRVFLYLDKVNMGGDNCVGFRLSQVFDSNLVLPVSATVFTYYEPEFRCSQSYHPKVEVDHKTPCHGNLCNCLERDCVELFEMADEDRNDKRNDAACEADYVFIIDVKGVTETASYVNINAALKTVLKKGMDRTIHVGATRSFVTPKHCGKNLNVSPGDNYLVMGLQNAHWRNCDRTQYILTTESWFEKFQLEVVCRLPSPPKSCQVSENFKGCSVL
uniref:complement C3-like n=1 Tax=Myxine glutinosa TaxID=7769 RepID=UPI00358FBAE5